MLSITGPLACYLYEKCKIRKQKFLIEQGNFMDEPSPSLLIVDLTLDQHKIASLMAGGKGKLMKTVAVEI